MKQHAGEVIPPRRGLPRHLDKSRETAAPHGAPGSPWFQARPPRSGFPGAASTCLHGHCLLSGAQDIHKAVTVVPIRWSGNEQNRRWTQIMNAPSSGPLHLVLLLCGTLLPPVLFLAHFLTCHEAS